MYVHVVFIARKVLVIAFFDANASFLTFSAPRPSTQLLEQDGTSFDEEACHTQTLEVT